MPIQFAYPCPSWCDKTCTVSTSNAALPKKKTKTWDPIDHLWNFFASLKLALTLITSILISCAIGTFVQQYDQVNKPMEEIYDPSTLKVLEMLGLTDLFHSSWFVTLVALLAVNLVVCSLERLPKIWNAAKRVPPPLDEKQFEKIDDPYLKSLEVKGESSQILDATIEFIKKKFHRPNILKNENDSFQIFFHRGLISKPAVWLIHTSLLIIMAGGVWGAFLGFEGAMNIPEGDTVGFFKQFKGETDLFPDYYEYGKRVPNFKTLPFQLKLKKFDLQFWESHPDRPKGFKSHLEVIEDGKVVHNQVIDVNDPLEWRGITFYQASYGEAGPGDFDLLHLDKSRRQKRELPKMTLNKPTIVTGDFNGKPYKMEVSIIDYDPKYQPGPMNLGPAIRMRVKGDPSTKKGVQTFWIMKNYPMWDLQKRETNFFFAIEKQNPHWFTGLQIARDPGANVVWFGSFWLLLGVWIALFYPHQRYWIQFKDGRLAIKGQSTKKREEFQDKFDKKFAQLVVHFQKQHGEQNS